MNVLETRPPNPQSLKTGEWAIMFRIVSVLRSPIQVAALFSCLALLVACGGGGSGSLPITGGGNSSPNYTTCTAQQVPNWRASTFQSSYQSAIQQLISHYGSTPGIGYIRIGLGRGGEINLPQGWNDSSSGSCYSAYTTAWGYTVGGDASFTWNAYLQSMIQYEKNLASSRPLLVSITPVIGGTTATDDFVASVSVTNGLSFGNQGLEASDISNYPNCGGDWCNLFAKYPSTPIRELQTIAQSCFIGTTCVSTLAASTGPLDPLIRKPQRSATARCPQPLLENAVKHGISQRADAGLIQVSAWLEGDQLYLSMRDDGYGIDPATSKEGGGLGNTRERLTTLYGIEASVTLRAAQGGGSEVVVQLPYKQVKR
jgi:hypothetical protein